MKKFSGLSMLLCLLLILQMVCMPVFATETDSTETEPVGSADTVVSDGTLGAVTVSSGCRSLAGQIPLGGTERMLDTAQAAFVYELNTGTVMYAYNPDLTLSPSALTKIVAAIVAIENGNLSDEVTINTDSYKTLPTGVQLTDLKYGEVLTLKDLLYCLILDMGNDAAISIAEHIAGSESNFVTMMNNLVSSIGCTGTVFTNCHGTEAAGQYTTARDMTRIVQYAIKNSDFAELFGAEEYTVPETERSKARELSTKNYLMEQTDITKFIDYDVTGGVAAYHSSSGASIAFTAEKNGLSVIIVIMGCTRTFASNGWTVTSYGNYEEAWELLAFAFDNYKICRLLHEGQSVSQFAVSNGENQVVGQTHTSMDVILPKEAKLVNLILKYSVEGGGLVAPIANDQKIATMQVWYRNSCVAETELYAMSSVSALNNTGLDIQGASRNDSNLSGILKILGYACLGILGLLVVYMVVNNIRRTIARNRRRRRRKGRRRSR